MHGALNWVCICTLRISFCVRRIQDVQPSSPAAQVGACSNPDFIIGADSPLPKSENLVFTMIESHEAKPVILYVCNTEMDAGRKVTIKTDMDPCREVTINTDMDAGREVTINADMEACREVTIIPNSVLGGESR